MQQVNAFFGVKALSQIQNVRTQYITFTHTQDFHDYALDLSKFDLIALNVT